MISVVIPSYNRENTISNSIESVLKQTYSDIEVIVVDDGSTDKTEDIVKGIGDNRIRYIKLEKNSGACVARNIGIMNANGSYIAFQDSDDIWHPDKLEKQYQAIKKYNADLVFCKMIKISPKTPPYVYPTQSSLGNLGI